MFPSLEGKLESWAKTYTDEIIFWSLIVLTFALPLILNPYCFGVFEVPKLFLLRIATLIALTAWIIKYFATGRCECKRASPNLAWLAFFLTALIATILSVNPHTSFYGELYRYEGLLTLANYAALYFLAFNFLDTEKKKTFWLYALFSSAAISSLLGILQQFGLTIIANTEAFGSRIFSTFGNPLYLGALLTLSIPVTVSYLLNKVEDGAASNSRVLNTKWFWILTLLVALQTSALLLTLARSSWIGLGIGLTILLLLKRRTIVLYYRQLALSFIVILLVAILVSGSMSLADTTSQATSTVGQRALSTFQISEGTSGNRIYIWKMTLPMIASRPFFGYGLDCYKIAFQKFRPIDWYKRILEQAIPDKAHNDLLQVAVNQGLVGLITYLILLISILKSLFSSIRKSRNSFEQNMLIGIAAAALAYLIQLQFSFSVISVAPLFWLMAGIGVSNSHYDDQTKTRPFEIGFFNSALLKAVCCVFVFLSALYLCVTIFLPFLADIYIMRGQEALTSSDFTEAVSRFEQALALNGAEARYYLFLKDAHFEEYRLTKDKEDAERLLDSLQRAQQLNPYQVEIYFGRGNLYREMAQKPDQKLLKKALNEYEHVLKIDPNNADAHFNMALVFFDLRDYHSAIDFWNETIHLNPRDEQAYMGMGEAYSLLGKLKEAKRAFENALEINPYNSVTKKKLQELTR